MTLYEATMRLLAEVQIMSDMQKQILKQTEILVQSTKQGIEQIIEHDNGDNRQ